MRKLIWSALFIMTNQIILCQELKSENLQEFIGKLYDNGKIHGGVLVAESNDVLYKDGWGLAKKSTNTAIDGDELFSINSMGKMFTAILTLQLVQEEAISLDDKLSELLPNFKHSRSSEITLHQLLSHRSGLRDYFLLQLSGQLPFDLSKDEMLIEISKLHLTFEPGTMFNYSNTGYVLLSLIVEKYRGKDFYKVMKEKLFSPLAMNNTIPSSKIDRSKMIDYFKEDGSVAQLSGNDYGGDGGEISTLEDMHTFMVALGSEKLLTKEMWELAFTPHSLPSEVPEDAWPPPHQDPYGYGFRPLSEGITAKAVAHGGAGLGTCFGVRYLESERVIINWNNVFKNPILFDLFKYMASE